MFAQNTTAHAAVGCVKFQRDSSIALDMHLRDVVRFQFNTEFRWINYTGCEPQGSVLLTSKHMPSEGWDEIPHPFPNFSVEVWERISFFHSTFYNGCN